MVGLEIFILMRVGYPEFTGANRHGLKIRILLAVNIVRAEMYRRKSATYEYSLLS
jgi:hypothetical protein